MWNIISFFLGCLASATLICIIFVRPYKNNIDELTSEKIFLASLLKKQFPSWEVFNGIHCHLVKEYRKLLGEILYKKFFTNQINFFAVENFLQKMSEEIFCSGKEKLLRDIFGEVVARLVETNTEGLVDAIARFVSEEKGEANSFFILISHAVDEKADKLAAKEFMDLFQKKVQELLANVDSTEERNRILEMQFLIE